MEFWCLRVFFVFVCVRVFPFVSRRAGVMNICNEELWVRVGYAIYMGITQRWLGESNPLGWLGLILLFVQWFFAHVVTSGALLESHLFKIN